ncbi:MAG: ribonuclease Z [Oscillospiraceae bacterium]
MVDVCLAGTGGMMPLKNRWLTCFFMEYNGKAMLIDCGEGTQIALADADCKLSKLDVLFITHFHADHISGLPGLLLSLGNFSKTTPLRIYGPKGCADIVKKLCCICPCLPYELEIHEINTDTSVTFTIPEMDMLEITAMSLRHKVDCLGYSFRFMKKPVFNPEKAKALNIPVQLWKNLHAGESVEADGKIYTPDMVLDGERPSTKITYCTDTLYFDELIEFAENSDLLVSEGMYGDEEYAEDMRKKGHMLFSQSADIALKSGSKELWLTHYSPALKNPNEYSGYVKGIFKNTVISRDGIKRTFK